METRPGISIVIPVFNTEIKKIDRCIKSILSQNYPNLEIIIVDDGSTPNCANHLDEYRIYSEINIIHKKNEGSGIARNAGIKEASKEYIMFVDSDDLIAPYVFKDVERVIISKHPDMVVGLVKKFGENDTSLLKYKKRKDSDLTIYRKEDREIYLSHIIGYKNQRLVRQEGEYTDGPCAKVCKTKIIKESYFPIENMWNDDTVWNINNVYKFNTIVLVDNVWYGYQIDLNSKTWKFRSNCTKEYKYRMLQETSLVNMYWPSCKKALYIRIWYDMNVFCRTYLFHKENNLNVIYRNRLFHEIVNFSCYQEMLNNISFDCVSSKMLRVYYFFLRFVTLHDKSIISYFCWMIDTYLKRIKNNLRGLKY